MNDVVLAVNPLFGSTIAGVLSLGLFVLAWVWNRHMQDSKWVGWACVILAVMGSVVLYASDLAVMLSGFATGVFNGAGSMFGWSSASPYVMGLVCLGALGITVYDLWHEPEHNPGAVAALLIAPIAAHGTHGTFSTIMDVIYGGLSIGTLDALQRFFGA